MVMPQNWLFLSSYKKQREHLLKQVTWNLLARLGSGAFDTISGEVVKAILLSLTKTTPNNKHLLSGVDASEPKTVQEKAGILERGQLSLVSQLLQLESPDSVIVFHNIETSSLLSESATINYGSKPGQTDRVVRLFWELEKLTDKWQYLESTPSGKSVFSGKEKLCFSLKEVEKQKISGFGVRSPDVWGKSGIIQSQMSDLPFSIYCGNIFDNNTSVLHANNDNELSALLAFLESGQYVEEIRKLNQKLDVAAHTMVKVPFDLEYWTKIAEEKYPNGLPKPYSDDPTQWIFHGHPAPAEEPLQVDVSTHFRTQG